MSTTATVTSVTGSAVTVSWTSLPGSTSYDVDIYTSATDPVTTGSTYVGTYTNQTSPATISVTIVLGNYYAATVTANFNSSISATRGPIFDPTSLSASLVTWFDGSYGLTASSWTNRGANGGSATLYSASTTTINGLGAARFPSASSGSSYGSFYQQFANQARAYFIVMKLNASSTGFQVLMSQTNAGGYNWNMYGYSSSCAKLLNNNNNGANTANPITQVYESYASDSDQTNLNVYSIVNSASSSANNYCYTNNTSRSLQTSATASGYNTSSVLTYIAAAPPGGMYSADCTICEVMAYDGEVSAYDGSNIRYYLGLKWGISIPQPPIQTAPTSINISGTPTISSAAVTWTAALGSPISYTVKIYQNSTSTVTTSSTLLVTQTSATSGSSISYSGTYSYYIAAVVTSIYSGGSQNSSISSAVQLPAAPTPAAPTNVNIPTTPDTTSVEVTWTAPSSSPISYTVRIYENSTSTVTTSSTLLLTKTSATSGYSISYSGTNGYWLAVTVTAVYSGSSYTSSISSSKQEVYSGGGGA